MQIQDNTYYKVFDIAYILTICHLCVSSLSIVFFAEHKLLIFFCLNSLIYTCGAYLSNVTVLFCVGGMLVKSGLFIVEFLVTARIVI